MTPPAFHVRYNEPMLRDAVRIFMWRRVFRRWGVWVAATMLLGFSVMSFTLNGADFVTGIGVAGLLCLALGTVALWRAHIANTVGRFRRMDPPEADIACRDDGLCIESSLGSAVLPWAGFTEVWERPGYLMLFTQPNAFSTLPTEAIPPQTLAALRSKLPPASR